MTAYEYKRDLNHNYLILTGDGQREDYRTRMLEKNTVPGLLPCSIRFVDDKVKFYYDISSRQPLGAAFAIRKMDYRSICRIFTQLETAMHELEKYLLDSRFILLDIRYLYWDMTEERLYLILSPEQEKKQEEQIRRFAEDLLNLVDYTDKQAVDAVYLFYQRSAVENFTLCRMAECFENMREEPEAERSRIIPVKEIRAEEEEEEIAEAADDSVQTSCDAAGKRSRMLSLLVIGAGAVLVFVLSWYVLQNYELTEQEILTGAGFLAMIPAVLLVRLVQKRQAARVEAEKPGIRDDETEIVEKPKEDRGGNLPEPERFLTGYGSEAQEQEEAYGETTYFQNGYDEPERCLEGRIHGKPVFISIDRTPFIVGKQEGAVSFVLPDLTVSRMHARFIEQEGKLFLQDMNSKNGTYKNGVAMEAAEVVEVRPGDEICFGRLRFTYH